jgi:HAD superfamily hydrolase (TIGR01509 family)
MDGTLVDSEPLHEDTLIASLITQGIEPPSNLHELVVGLSTIRIYEIFQSSFGLRIPFEEWCRQRYKNYLEKSSSLKAREGALELFRELQERGFQQAIVSNSDRIIVQANLQVIGLDDPEMITVSRNDVIQGKPHPECYLRALYLMKKSADQVAVLEDSTTGALAGVAAGAKTIFWPQVASPTIPNGAIFVSKMDDIRRLLDISDLI